MFCGLSKSRPLCRTSGLVGKKKKEDYTEGERFEVSGTCRESIVAVFLKLSDSGIPQPPSQQGKKVNVKDEIKQQKKLSVRGFVWSSPARRLPALF